MPGVILTRVGYAGGTTKNPTYRNLGDHSEAVQIDFDPTRIAYRELVNMFWESHDPSRSSWSRQYRAAIFYHSEQQRLGAFETRNALYGHTSAEIVTSIEPYEGFYIAEDYHQKHSMRLFPEIMEEFTIRHPDMKSLLESTAATRVNGYLGGYGSCEDLKNEIDDFGLSDRAKRQVLSIVCRRAATTACPVR